MKKFLAVVCFCLPAFGQAAYSGLGLHSGSATYAAPGSSCAAPNFCAYNGVDLIPWGTVPNLGGATNNNATVFDTSFLGHLSRDGSTFSNSGYLSPVTRVTDSQSAGGASATLVGSYTAGINGAGFSPALTNSNTTLVSLTDDRTSAQHIGRFNTSGTNKGHFCSNALAGCTTWFSNATAYPVAGNGDLWITEAQKAGGSCSSNCTAVDFGTVQFDRNNPNLMYSAGMGTDITTPTTETPFYISQTTGEYWIGTTVADFKYALPAYQASNWATSTNYSYGQYVIHPLPTPEMATGGTWTTGHVYLPGDIVQGGTGGCMYKVATASGTSTSGSAPAFLTSGCKLETLTDAAGNHWQGTASTAQFIYQETNPACTVSSPCQSAGSAFQWLATPGVICSTSSSGNIAAGATSVTCTTSSFTAAMVGQTIGIPGAGVSGATFYTTIASVTSPPSATATLAAPTITATPAATAVAISLTGHPDMLSQASGLDANGLAWTSIEPAYIQANGNQGWQGVGNTSIDTANTITVTGAPGSPYFGASKFAAAFSQNSYGMQPSFSGGINMANYNAGQGTGVDLVMYDETLNVYHLLNTLTGIVTDWTCSGGTGPTCSGGAWPWSTVGTFQAITNPLSTGQPCPWTLHGGNMTKNGLYIMVEEGNVPYKACSNASSGLKTSMVWAPTSASFNAYSSLQYTEFGVNHYALRSNTVATFTSSGWGYDSGVYVGIYALNNAQGNSGGNPVYGSGSPPPFSVYLPAFASQSDSQTYPYPGCYVISGSTIESPGCGVSYGLDSHLSGAADPGTDTWPACGTTYNVATLNPVPFMQWQGMETCYQTSPTYPTGYTPASSWSSNPPGNGSPLCTPGTNCTQTYGNVWQFTHTWNTGTSVTFSMQFAISQLSQDGNWIFFSTDEDDCLGSNLAGNAAPAVWSSGTYYQQLMVTATSSTAAPICTPPNSLGGVPWLPVATYAVGNLINPIEGANGSSSVDDVYQAIAVTGVSGPASTLSGKQPKCGSVSCWTLTNAPTATNGGDYVCDSTSGSANVVSTWPTLPTCTTGIIWEDLGPQTQRGDVFAVNLGLN